MSSTAEYSDQFRQPKGIRILPDEILVCNPEDIDLDLPDRPLSAIKAMIGLTAVKRSHEIGKNGPSIAANARQEHRNNPDFNKYNVFFPRDGHVVAEFVFDLHPELTRATVLASLEYIGIRDNYSQPQLPFDEQEPGKIAHEIRDPQDPIAVKLTNEKNWGWPYYGAVDTTGKNIIAINRLVHHPDYGTAFLAESYTARDGQTYSALQGFEQNLHWLLNRMDKNPEGLVESLDKNPLQHPNQVWTDSPESFHHRDGAWAEHHPEHNYGVAAVDQQAEAYDALRSAADIYEAIGRRDQATALRQRARRLQLTVLDTFWVKDDTHFGGYFARGTDRDETGKLRPLAIRSSDMGHLLHSGILDDTDDTTLNDEIAYKREAVIRNLFSPEMMCPSGVRTLSSDSFRYSDDRYHNGTAWPWVSYYIAKGLDRHGYHGLAFELKKRVWENYDATKILGEYASGSPHPAHRLVTQKVTVHNDALTHEPRYHVSQPAQEIQAWTAAAIYAMKREYAAVVARKLGCRHLKRIRDTFHIRALDTNKARFEASILTNLRHSHLTRIK